MSVIVFLHKIQIGLQCASRTMRADRLRHWMQRSPVPASNLAESKSNFRLWLQVCSISTASLITIIEIVSLREIHIDPQCVNHQTRKTN